MNAPADARNGSPRRFDAGAVLFDLDGTLLDTAPDMGHALNRLLDENGRGPLPAATIRPHVSHGSRGLLGLGFGLTPDDDGYTVLRDRFLALYRTALAVDTRPFDGVPALLDALTGRGLAWGIVTNKPGALTASLLDALALRPASGCVVSGDTVAVAKPHPEPLLHACRQLGLAPEDCLYVGDAERDIVAARRAGMPALVARYGYLGSDDRPQDWGAHGAIDAPLALLDWLA